MHSVSTLPFQETGYFTKIMKDYLEQRESLIPFYNEFPKLENFEKQIGFKKQSYPTSSRKILVESLQDQYRNFKISDASQNNIALLAKDNTFTVVTGHQLNLFSGPLYFFYKIINTVNLCESLKEKYPDYNFVPIYWMATEDHDFEEINFFNYKSKKIKWNRKSSGPVGRLKTDSLEPVFEDFSKELGLSKNADRLRDLFQQSYLKHKNLADATRFLANELFGDYGLVILDGDHRSLKLLFAPYMKEDLLSQTCFEQVNQTNSILAEDYKIQVNPREINLFYIKDGLRERIIFENDFYLVNQTKLKFTEAELLEELKNFPERFSPNVLMRPLYEEVILPNLCYIGGGGELAYWLQLKSFFESQNILFPVLLLRNSALISTKKQAKKLDKLGISKKQFFLPTEDLTNQIIKKRSAISIDFSQQREEFKNIFDTLFLIAEKTDKSFSGAVKAQERKQLNGLDTLEKRLLKAEKRKESELVSRISELKEILFPKGGLQERISNFSNFYEEFGDEFIQILKESFDPLHLEFYLIEI